LAEADVEIENFAKKLDISSDKLASSLKQLTGLTNDEFRDALEKLGVEVDDLTNDTLEKYQKKIEDLATSTDGANEKLKLIAAL
jgi:arginyl-tRNA synthetase